MLHSLKNPTPPGPPSAVHVVVQGLVQGVGFRPFVWRLARQQRLVGWVRNHDNGVEIFAQGPLLSLHDFARAVQTNAPTQARVDHVAVSPATPGQHTDFVIADSVGSGRGARIGPDTAPCPSCLDDLCNPHNRRWRHPFVHCTECGPRYSLTYALPYDRQRTSMAGFAMCPDCAREYADPFSRRFHAEPICCPRCGPQLQCHDAHGQSVSGDPVGQALALLQQGAVLAIKGMGGFHLACDARRPELVARLRQGKQRDAKPFAIMGLNLASLVRWVELDIAARHSLLDPGRPIVLVPPKTGVELPGIAPGLARLGVMLPSTPVHYLLWHEAAGRPDGTAWLEQESSLLLIMTSGNPAGEPVVTGNAAAVDQLGHVADAFLVHDRDIVARCDDSVVASHAVVRRARGQAPDPVRLMQPGPAVLALGGWYKNTVCLTRGDLAFVSPHIGDLNSPASVRFLEESVQHLLTLASIRPTRLACDLHPDFASSQLAARLSQEWHIPLVAVQHHHAHIASTLAEHAVNRPVLGLALDGIGLGLDGTAWGGELLHVDGAQCDRLAGLVPLPLPGGDRAAREPWRMAAAVLWRAQRGDDIARRFAAFDAAPSLSQIIGRPHLSPPCSSLGRVFDAAASLLGLCHLNHFEAQAAMLLEAEAVRHGPVPAWHHGWSIQANGSLDLLPLLLRLADESDPAYGAALFHATLIQALLAWSVQTLERTGLRDLAGGGGCLLNGVLAHGLQQGLADAGLTGWWPRRVPPNDAGISLGQAWIVRQTLLD